MILKAILCVHHFYSFGAILFIVNLFIKRIPLLFVFLVYLSMFIMSHFLYKIAYLEDIWSELVEFCVLSELHHLNPDLSK